MKSNNCTNQAERVWAGFFQLLVIVCVQYVPNATAQSMAAECGEIDPKGDYIGNRSNLKIVEDFHFTPAVESLVSGNTSRTPGGDLDYTLRAFPNHHRALVSMMRLGQKEHTPKPRDAKFTVECYFVRALRFRSDDAVARMLYASYLTGERREADAQAQLDWVAGSAADNPFTHFNLGLLYVDLKNFDRAQWHAHRAMVLGFNKTELRDKLIAAGQWKEPDPVRDAVAPASQSPKASDAAASNSTK